jgi:hypothetical protein
MPEGGAKTGEAPALAGGCGGEGRAFAPFARARRRASFMFRRTSSYDAARAALTAAVRVDEVKSIRNEADRMKLYELLSVTVIHGAASRLLTNSTSQV